MYYIVFIVLYVLAVFLFIKWVKRPSTNEKRAFKKKLVKESAKGYSKYDVRPRKERIKALPLFWRFLYWCWFGSVMVMIIGFPILFCIIRWVVLRQLVMPPDVLFYELGGGATLVFGIGGFFAGIPLLVLYSYITNRGIIGRADAVYQLGSFQEYPKRVNIFISGICGLLGLLIMFLPCNSYRYCTDDTITVKRTFAMHEAAYEYSQIDHVGKKTNISKGDEFYDYTFYTANGERFQFGEDMFNDSLESVLKQKNVEIINEN